MLNLITNSVIVSHFSLSFFLHLVNTSMIDALSQVERLFKDEATKEKGERARMVTHFIFLKHMFGLEFIYAWF